MRSTVTVVVLLALLGAFAYLLAIRPLPPDGPPRPATVSAANEGTATDPAAPADNTAPTDPAASATTTPDGAPAPAPAPDPEAPPTVVRVAGLGWELLAPGVLGNDGLDPGAASEFTAAKIEAHFAAVADVDAIQKRLAQGGGDDKGADVALLPLPDFVASYERLRGLDPQVFFVVGWSSGRDALAARQQKSLNKLPAKITLAGAPGRSSTLLGLFTLELVGVPPSQVELVAEHRAEAMFAAVDRAPKAGRPGIDARDLLLTTADATDLVPLVAIAPAGYVQRNAEVLERWARVWLAATTRLQSDVPAASRRLAREAGAPEPVDLLDGLGSIRHASLVDNAQLAGLSGRGAVTIDELFHRAWTLWRGVGVLSTPPPPHAPMSNQIISRVALSETRAVTSAEERRPRRGEPKILLTHAIAGATLDEQAVLAEIGLLAGVFSRSEIEVRLRRRAGKVGPLIEAAQRRFGLPPGRLREGKPHGSGPVAVLAVFAAE